MLIYKHRILFKTILIVLLTSFIGCVTTKVTYVENDKLPVNKVYRISEVFLKSGEVINLKDTEPKFKLKYKGMENVITYYDDDYNTKFIQLKDVNKIKIEIVESNQVLTAIIIVGVTALVFILAFLIALATIGFTMH